MIRGHESKIAEGPLAGWAAQAVYALNALWFAAGFASFSLAQGRTLKMLVPHEARQDRLVPTIMAAVSFLGGMNAALGAFCVFLAARPDLFAGRAERAATLTFLAACNFSQFACNLPVAARGGRRGVAWWPVLAGPMLMIFIVDLALAIADLAAAALLGQG